MKRSAAEILREYGPFPGVDHVHGVTYDGQRVWFAAGDKLNAFDPASGNTLRSIEVAANAGTASTVSTCFRSPRIALTRSIRRPAVCSLPSRRPAAAVTRGLLGPKGRFGWDSIGIARSIKSIPKRGAVIRTIESNRFVTGVTWVDGELGTAPGKVRRAI